MKLVKVLLPLAAVGLIMGTASARDIDGFYGKVEQMPTAENPAWVIGGKTFKQLIECLQPNRRAVIEVKGTRNK